MKTIPLLHDEARQPTYLLQNAVRAVPLREIEAAAGCNCDRWGHPCQNCVGSNVQPKAKVPISSPAKQPS
jgi:hypothetical protein